MSLPVNRIITLSSLRLNLYEWGTPDQPPLILLHGLASTSHMFDLVAPQLAANYHVIAYDQRGHGLSEKPDNASQQLPASSASHSPSPLAERGPGGEVTGYDFEIVAADLDQLADSLGLGSQPFALAGHSWGAYTSLYYAATRPARVRKAILIDGGLRPMTDYFSRMEDMVPPQHHHWSLAEVKRMIREDWLGAAFRPELEPLVLSIYDISNPDDVRPHLKLADHMQIARALWDFRAPNYYPQIQCPLLIINAVGVGESPNPRLQSHVADARQQIHHCEAVWMRDTIHDIPWHRPQELAEIMQGFLGQ